MNAPVNIEVPKGTVYAKIAAVQGALARTGIAKDRKNQTPGASYNFRGIDEVYNALARLLAENGLCILPRMVGHSLTERGKTAKGNAIFSAIVEAEFDFVSADDGSTHTVRSYGEAMDSSDKATNKAMSAAYKYMALMTFAIPTEGDNDADATTHEIVHEPVQKPKIDPNARINDKTRHAFQDLIITTGGDVSAFCREHGLMSLSDLTNDRAAELAAPLKEKREAAKAAPFGEVLAGEVPY